MSELAQTLEALLEAFPLNPQREARANQLFYCGFYKPEYSPQTLIYEDRGMLVAIPAYASQPEVWMLPLREAKLEKAMERLALAHGWGCFQVSPQPVPPSTQRLLSVAGSPSTVCWRVLLPMAEPASVGWSSGVSHQVKWVAMAQRLLAAHRAVRDGL